MKIQSDLIIKRKRIYYTIAIFTSIALGLASRHFHTLPNFVVIHAGDTLWAIMVYFFFRLLLLHNSSNKVFFISLLFCFSIEFSQLYKADWINTIRDTLLGSLILGKGFLVVDLVRYSAGIMLAYLTDRWVS